MTDGEPVTVFVPPEGLAVDPQRTEQAAWRVHHQLARLRVDANFTPARGGTRSANVGAGTDSA